MTSSPAPPTPSPSGYLDAPDFAPQLHLAFCDGEKSAHLLAQLPILGLFMAIFPGWLTKRLNPAVHDLFECNANVRKQVTQLIAERELPGADAKDNAAVATVVSHLHGAAVPADEKSPAHIGDEIHSVFAAGTLTTSASLPLTTYMVLTQPSVLATLQAELAAAMPDPAVLPPVAALEKLPYLTAVVLEGLRVTDGVPHRLSRVAPDAALRYAGRVIPAGVPVSMSAAHVHRDPRCWGDDAAVFRPERWLPLDIKGAALQKYFVVFGKGSRSCLGQSLAYAELYLVLAMVVRRCGARMDTADTVYEEHVQTVMDAFVGLPLDYRHGLRVNVYPGQKS